MPLMSFPLEPSATFTVKEATRNSVPQLQVVKIEPGLHPSGVRSTLMSCSRDLDDPQSVKYSVAPISSVLAEGPGKMALEAAVDAYYAQQVNVWVNATSCAACLPVTRSILLAVNFSFGIT